MPSSASCFSTATTSARRSICDGRAITAPCGSTIAQSATSVSVADSLTGAISCTVTPRSRSVRTKMPCCSCARSAIGDGSPLMGGKRSTAADGPQNDGAGKGAGIGGNVRGGIGLHGHDQRGFAGRRLGS